MGKQLERVGRVVDFHLNENTTIMLVRDRFNKCFAEGFTKKQFGELIDELKELHSVMEGK